jgi:4-methyl-5(b-hydroxyethyl)-thiazole monophosphate biosynthesis
MKKKVLVPIADGIEELEAVGIIDTLRRADADVIVASVDELQITGSCGIKIIADKLIKNCADEQYDMIVLPGGLPGAEHLRDSQTLTSLLKKPASEGKYYAAIGKRVVVDGNCITSRSRGTVLEFSIQLIELLYDKDKAEEIKTTMLAQ